MANPRGAHPSAPRAFPLELIGRIATPRVSVVIPALNEARNLPHVLPRIPSTVFEVILVDGGSTDGTIEVTRRLRPETVVLAQRRIGKGDAFATGFEAARGDIIVTLDADGSTDPIEIPQFVEALIRGGDFAKGTRFAEGGGSADLTPVRRLGTQLLTGVANRLHGSAYTDLNYGLCAFWRHCLPHLDLDCDGFEVEALMGVRLAKANLEAREVGSFEHRRLYGSSNLRIVRDGVRVLRTILAERRPRSHRPRLQPDLSSPRWAVHEASGPERVGTAADAPELPVVEVTGTIGSRPGDRRSMVTGGEREWTGRPPAKPWLEIAFVNNMPDPAFFDTESQFRRLLAAAAQTTPIRLRSYWMPGIPRGPEVMQRLQQAYREVGSLWSTPVDAVIITGTEPVARRLTEERYWQTLSDLLAWAEETTSSALLSCLAAHAAILQFDGIQRTPLAVKQSGVFVNDVTRPHRLTVRMPEAVAVPHSRLHDIPTSSLVRRGYVPLIQSQDAWSSMAVDRGRCLFILNQGHPEYAPLSLLREYRRDLRRYLSGRSPIRPTVPSGYLDEEGEAILAAFEQSAIRRAHAESAFAEFPLARLEHHLAASWADWAEALFANWIDEIVARARGPRLQMAPAGRDSVVA